MNGYREFQHIHSSILDYLFSVKLYTCNSNIIFKTYKFIRYISTKHRNRYISTYSDFYSTCYPTYKNMSLLSKQTKPLTNQEENLKVPIHVYECLHRRFVVVKQFIKQIFIMIILFLSELCFQMIF